MAECSNNQRQCHQENQPWYVVMRDDLELVSAKECRQNQLCVRVLPSLSPRTFEQLNSKLPPRPLIRDCLFADVFTGVRHVDPSTAVTSERERRDTQEKVFRATRADENTNHGYRLAGNDPNLVDTSCPLITFT